MLSLFDRFLKNIIKRGELIVYEWDGTRHVYGMAHPDWPAITIRFADKGAPGYIARHPRLGAAEAYMDGRMKVDGDDIRGLIALIRSNDAWDERGGAGLGGKGLKYYAGELLRRLNNRNHEARSKKNVAHHYDLDDRLYDLFLDADRQYSCAYFREDEMPLDEAQLDKKAHIASKLHLKPGQTVLDIGCGWGGMALYLHRVADVDVLGVTLSEEQLKVARRRAAEAGVADRVKFELIDYRNVTGHFDRIVSVGMFEHVGVPHYEEFFAKCKTLLADDGVMLLHTIGRMGRPGTTDAFTDKYIFPGGYNPALSEIVGASERVRMIAADVETLRLHYAKTIDHWYDRCVAKRAEIEKLYDARFYRMWSFYLAGAMAAFRYGGMCNFQIQYIKRRHALPITRDYMIAAETELRSRG